MTRVALCIYGTVRNISFSNIFKNMGHIADHVDAFVSLRREELNKDGHYRKYNTPLLDNNNVINIATYNILYGDPVWVNCSCHSPYMQGFMNRLESLKWCGESVTAYEHRLHSQYDAIVAMRSDLTFTSPMYPVSRMRHLWHDRFPRAYVDRDHFWVIPRGKHHILFNPINNVFNQCNNRSCFKSTSEYYIRRYFYKQNIPCVPISLKQILIRGSVRKGGASFENLVHDCHSNIKIQKYAISNNSLNI